MMLEQVKARLQLLGEDLAASQARCHSEKLRRKRLPWLLRARRPLWRGSQSLTTSSPSRLHTLPVLARCRPSSARATQSVAFSRAHLPRTVGQHRRQVLAQERKDRNDRLADSRWSAEKVSRFETSAEYTYIHTMSSRVAEQDKVVDTGNGLGTTEEDPW